MAKRSVEDVLAGCGFRCCEPVADQSAAEARRHGSPLCGAEMRIIAFITDPSTIRDLLLHLGAPTAPPRIAPARGPPLWDLPDAGAGGSNPNAEPAPEYEFDQRLAW